MPKLTPSKRKAISAADGTTPPPSKRKAISAADGTTPPPKKRKTSRRTSTNPVNQVAEGFRVPAGKRGRGKEMLEPGIALTPHGYVLINGTRPEALSHNIVETAHKTSGEDLLTATIAAMEKHGVDKAIVDRLRTGAHRIMIKHHLFASGLQFVFTVKQVLFGPAFPIVKIPSNTDKFLYDLTMSNTTLEVVGAKLKPGKESEDFSVAHADLEAPLRQTQRLLSATHPIQIMNMSLKKCQTDEHDKVWESIAPLIAAVFILEKSKTYPAIADSLTIFFDKEWKEGCSNGGDWFTSAWGDEDDPQYSRLLASDKIQPGKIGTKAFRIAGSTLKKARDEKLGMEILVELIALSVYGGDLLPDSSDYEAIEEAEEDVAEDTL